MLTLLARQEVFHKICGRAPLLKIFFEDTSMFPEISHELRAETFSSSALLEETIDVFHMI